KTMYASAEYKNAVNQKEQITYSGFIAQEVEAAAKRLNYNFSGVDAPKNEKDLYGLRYAEFTVPLVKAVQELNKENMELRKENEEIKKQLAVINERLNSYGNNSPIEQNVLNNPKDKAMLDQNIPNPFNKNTSIGYNIPE